MSLEALVGQRFVSRRHGQRTEVKLEEVRRRKVMVREADRTDSYGLEINQFMKLFRPMNKKLSMPV